MHSDNNQTQIHKYVKLADILSVADDNNDIFYTLFTGRVRGPLTAAGMFSASWLRADFIKVSGGPHRALS